MFVKSLHHAILEFYLYFFIIIIVLITPHTLHLPLSHSPPPPLTYSCTHLPLSHIHAHTSLPTPDTRLHAYTPRLFELNSTTGEFVAHEVLDPARGDSHKAFPFLQTDLYSAKQPGTLIPVSLIPIPHQLFWSHSHST